MFIRELRKDPRKLRGLDANRTYVLCHGIDRCEDVTDTRLHSAEVPMIRIH